MQRRVGSHAAATRRVLRAVKVAQRLQPVAALRGGGAPRQRARLTRCKEAPNDASICAVKSRRGVQACSNAAGGARARLAEPGEHAARQHALVRVQVRPAQPAARRRGACSRRRVSASVPPRHRLKQPKRSSAARGMGRTWRACCRAAAPPATRRSRGSGSAGHRRHRRFARPLQVSTPALAPPPPRRKTGRTRPAARHPPRACRRAAPPPG